MYNSLFLFYYKVCIMNYKTERVDLFMKKVIWSSLLLISFIVFGGETTFAKELSSYNYYTTELSDNIIDRLTEEDFVTANEITTQNKDYIALSEQEKNNYINKVYTSIVQRKPLITPAYLPAAASSLNAEEKKLLKKYPSQAALVYTASNLATKRTNALYKNGLHNGNGDAFRHTYWNSEMATMLAGYGSSFNLTNGKANAKRWADAHETGAKNQPALEKSMDLHNNNIGRSLVSKKMSSKTLELESLKKVNNGSCRRISGKSLVKTTSAK